MRFRVLIRAHFNVGCILRNAVGQRGLICGFAIGRFIGRFCGRDRHGAELDAAGQGFRILQRVIYRHRAHGQRVYAVLLEQACGDLHFAGIRYILAERDGVVIGVGYFVGVAAHIAIRDPHEGKVFLRHVVDVIEVTDALALRGDDQVRYRNGQGCFLAGEEDRSFGIGIIRVIIRVRGDRQLIAQILGQTAHRDIQHRGIGAYIILREADIVVRIGNDDIVGSDVAIGEPAGGGDAGRVHCSGYHVFVALLLHKAAQGDFRRADLLRRVVFGRVAVKDRCQRFGIRHAVGVQPVRALEQPYRLLGLCAVIAGAVAVKVVQLGKPALQFFHAGIIIAAAQRDVAAVFRRAFRKQLRLQGCAGSAGLAQTDFGLEAPHGFRRRRRIIAARIAFEVVKRLQAFVQGAHAVAAVALAQFNVGGAFRRAAGIQALQGGFVRDAVHRQTVFLLEQLHGGFGAFAKDAIRIVRQIAQIAQALLHVAHAPAGAADGNLAIGAVRLKSARQNQLLQVGIRNAGCAQTQIALQHFYRQLGAPAVDAVDVVIVVAQIVEGLLNGGNRFAAAAPAQRGILRRGLQQRGYRIFAIDGVGAQQHGFRRCIRNRGARAVHKGERGQRIRAGYRAVYVQLAADRFDREAGYLLAGGYIIAGFIRQRGELHQAAVAYIHAVYDVVLAQHEQRARAGGQLRFHFNIGHEYDVPGGVRGAVALQRDIAAYTGDVIDVASDDRPILHVGIHKRAGGRARGLYVQLLLAVGIDVERIEVLDFIGDIAVVGDEFAADRILNVCAGIRYLRGDYAAGGVVHAIQIFDGGQYGLRLAAVDIAANQLFRIRLADVVDAVVCDARGGGVLRQHGFPIRVQ